MEAEACNASSQTQRLQDQDQPGLTEKPGLKTKWVDYREMAS